MIKRKPRTGYFLNDYTDLCRQDLLQTLKLFREEDISFLITALREGKVNGCFYTDDLIGTLARARGKTAEELCEEIGYERDFDKHPAEHWFFQIGGADNTPNDSEFVQLAVQWCYDTLEL